MHVRLYIDPYLGQKRLDKVTVRDVRSLFNRLATTCQCRAQGKDAARAEPDRRCCAIGDCCGQTLSRRTVHEVAVRLKQCGRGRTRRQERGQPRQGAHAATAQGQTLVRGGGQTLPGLRQGWWRSLLSRLRAARVHDTRHTCGSLLAALDVRPRVAMQILRHNKIDTMMEIYTHVPSETTTRALKQLGASLEDLEP